MKEQMKLLIELQEVDSAIGRKTELITAIPRKISSVEHYLKDAAARFEKQKQKAEAAEKKKKEKERSLDDVNEKIRKLKMRTTEIKNNKEYQAHLKEIDAAERERRLVEDEILVLMESADAAHKEVKTEEVKVRTENAKVEEYRKKLSEEVAAAEKELEELQRRRSGQVATIDKENYTLYSKVFGSARGLAVVAARDERCQGCHMNIPPQLFVELKRNERLIQCPQCTRILYWKEEVLSP
ncbi:MAG TPA: C4-type zinc ribbon domain-containing protein [Thermodesulfovibrionales bacterium]|nr:C4-type zinc ribbon domain-containing protein [Thermodesulfovibrionales bacterium]